MADSHNPQVWRELLTQFRDGHAKFSRSPLYLKAMTFVTNLNLTLANKTNKLDVIEELGSVCWYACQGDIKRTPLQFWAAIELLPGAADEEDDALNEEFGRKALECFRPLVKQAGAHLPPSVRKAIPGDPHAAGSNWCSLLWWFNAEDCFDTSAILSTTNYISSFPFEDSIKVIERCGLTGDSPAFPFSISFVGDKVIVEANEAQETPAEVNVAGSDNEVGSKPLGAPLKSNAKGGKKRKRGGQRKYDPESDRKLARNWEIASRHGTYKADFARDNNLSPKDFDNLLDRVRKAKINDAE